MRFCLIGSLCLGLMLLGSCATVVDTSYEITGVVQSPGGDGIGGVEVAAGGSGQITASDGSFFFNGLMGTVTINMPVQQGKLFVPERRTVNAGGAVEPFVMHVVQPIGESLTLPPYQVMAFPQTLLDFRQAGLPPDSTVTAAAATVGPKGDMEVAGPVHTFSVTEDVTGTIILKMEVEDAQSSLFFYQEDSGAWEYVPSSYDGRFLSAVLNHFSTYGVFRAPETVMPQATPAGGTVLPGTTITLTGDRTYYTKDGSTPTRESAQFNPDNPPVVGSEGLQLKAISYNANQRPSAIAEFSYTPMEVTYTDGVGSGTLISGQAYYDFDAGEFTDDLGAGDVRLVHHAQTGSGFTNVRLDGYAGKRFPVAYDETNPNWRYETFWNLTVSDWDDATPIFDLTAPYDTYLIQTSSGRIVKVLITAVRKTWHYDRPEVDFLYFFADAIDHQQPQLVTATLYTEDDDEVISVPFANEMEFHPMSKPTHLVFEFNEIVRTGRPMRVYYGEWESFSWIWFSREESMRPPYSDRFRAQVHFQTFHEAPLIIKTASSYADYPEYGFYFSDIMGNAWLELPFDRIVIHYQDSAP